MRKERTQSKGISKGAPSGFLISILIHAGAFMLAGLLVVFSVTQKEEKKFVPPKPVDRPKMKLKKPKVKVKKSSKPRATNRIVTKVQKASMPDIQLPELSGIGDNLSGDIGGFEIMPDLGQLSVLGSSQSIGSDLEGTYYDLKLDRQGRFISNDKETFRANMIDFIRKGWRPSTLAKFFRSPNKIYATSLVVPTTQSSIAPAAFGDKDASGAQWMVHYKGELVHAEGITFRFWAAADETLLVRVDGEIVIGAKWANTDTGWSNVEPDTVTPFWQSSSMDSYRFILGNSRAAVGDWITLEPGVPLDLEIIIGDNGGKANFCLAVEEQGVEYPESKQGGPILPVFKTAPISRDMMDIIYKDLVEGEVSLTNGPVFNDYGGSSAEKNAVAAASENPPLVEPSPEVSGVGVWELQDGTDFEAELVNVMAGMAVFKNARNKTVKVPLENMTDTSRHNIGLSLPPEFDINFVRDHNQKTFAMDSYDVNNIRPPELRCYYGFRLSQKGSGDYPYRVNAEMFVIGQERLGTKYIVLDRQKTSFVPTRENGKSHSFKSSQEVVLQNYEVENEPRGEKYAGYLVILTDERGREIGYSTSNEWLYKNLGNLKRQKPGNYINKQCERVFPTRPPATLY
ncbi:hypothetical protein [Pontiella agarivorans]|uniref:PA14 domain-containing protein n=1 Tax=Pontiella agarivorans TaxID=3038953 RepID=A0ABU5N249_9BACT|nr:hypothetical protein [Pontiella agarivorans]MDZ8120520.1 hypothetical protein [Pontiella agarivorans]